MKYFLALKTSDIISLIILIAAGFGWIMIDQLFLTETYQRMIALVLVLVLLYFLQFVINKPQQVWAYTNTIALISVLFVIVISIVLHVIVHHDFSAKGFIILAVTAAVPYCAAGIWSLARKQKD